MLALRLTLLAAVTPMWVGNTDGTWTEANSEVVCRELGYSTNGLWCELLVS